MDKINLANWNDIFGKTEQKVLFASERYTDLHFCFEEPGLASGSIRSVSTPGMQLTELSLHSGQPFQLSDEPKETAESVFLLDGGAESQFHNISAPLLFNKHHHNLQYNSQFGGTHTISSPRFHALTITYDLSFLHELFESDENRSIGQLANAVQRGETFLASHCALQSGGRIAEVIGTITQCPFTGSTRYLFLESKMMELFVLQMEQAQLAAGRKGDEWTPADREKLHAVKHYIENAYLETFSLKDLTYQFGLNEFKLKKGYKQLFQTTIFGHVHRLRLQKARMLLQEKTFTVGEAAFFIGYNNVSSFCTEFKKQFGYSPGRYKLCADVA
ncbi:helix-turn-helix transcriptional regulator [Chitinophaga sp. GCM10012297]|uniref:Helix-turn-helix transcriptional regulator n=1 Tax=Chitinophaga chungangae TaxID=2821488 RepID=A0ABS3YK82_9BACT|nr:AraC family transcriptional regulator [Chitinophaga chungangae]MBO9154718.1 helix-turn-helix transcriptional regulator [Chitinophaga chungangae]